MKTLKKKYRVNKKKTLRKKREKKKITKRKKNKNKTTIKKLGGYPGNTPPVPQQWGNDNPITGRAFGNNNQITAMATRGITHAIPPEVVTPKQDIPVRQQLEHITPNKAMETRGITSPVLPVVSLDEIAFPQQQDFWNKNTVSKTAGTLAAMAAGGIALGFSPVVVLGSAVPTAMANSAFQENPAGFIATAITPIAETLFYSGVYSAEQINEAANYLLNQADPTFSANRYFDINEQNGNLRVGTLDRIEGEVTDLGFYESINGLINGLFGHGAIVGYNNFIHEREQNNNAPNNNFENINSNGANSNVRINENIVLPSMFSATIGLPEIIAMTTGETNTILNDIIQNTSNPETFRAQLSAANAAASAAIQAAMERQSQRAEKNEIKLKQFNENGQHIIENLQKAETIRARRAQQSEAEVNKYNQEVAGPRVRAIQNAQQREQEAENQSIAAQVIIDQQYADAMPEFNNPETPLEQQYDPRFGQQYAENLERFVTNALSVRQEPNFNANNIGDTSAIFATSAYILRGIIGKLFRKSKAKLDKTKDISKKNKITKLNRIIKSPIEVENEMITNHGINLRRPDTLQLPEITNVPPQDVFHTIPIPIPTAVNTYYANPTYDVYIASSDWSPWSVSPVLEIIMENNKEEEDDSEPPPLMEDEDGIVDSVPMDTEQMDEESMDEESMDEEPRYEEEPENMDSLQMDIEQEYPYISKFLKIVNFSYNDQPNISEELIQYVSNKENAEVLEQVLQNYQGDFDFIEENVIPNNKHTKEERQEACQAFIVQILQDNKNTYSSSNTTDNYHNHDILERQNSTTSNIIPTTQTTYPIYNLTSTNQRVTV